MRYLQRFSFAMAKFIIYHNILSIEACYKQGTPWHGSEADIINCMGNIINNPIEQAHPVDVTFGARSIKLSVLDMEAEKPVIHKKYKFDPEDFRNMPCLSDDLKVFYSLVETYKRDETLENRFAFRKQWKDLFLSIKHRQVEGFLNPVVADEIRAYLEELAND